MLNLLQSDRNDSTEWLVVRTQSSREKPPNYRYDFACIFGALHDLGDPVGVAQNIYSLLLGEEKTFMVVEPLAVDSLTDNLNFWGPYFTVFLNWFVSSILYLKKSDLSLCSLS